MSAESIKLGEVFTQLTVQSDGLQKGLTDASEKIRKFGQRAEEFTSKFNAAFSGLGKAIQPIAPAISLCGMSISGVSATLVTLDNIVRMFLLWRQASLQNVAAKEADAAATTQQTATTQAANAVYTESILIKKAAVSANIDLAKSILAVLYAQNMCNQAMITGTGTSSALTNSTQLATVTQGTMASTNVVESTALALSSRSRVISVTTVNADTAAKIGNTGATVTNMFAIKAGAVGIGLWSIAAKIGTVVTGFFSAAVNFLTTSLGLCPFTATVVAILAIAAALAGIVYLFLGGESAATKHAKAMEEVRKQNDETRKAGEQYAESLEKLSQKEELSAEEKEHAKRLITDLQETNRKLGKSTEELGVAYDEATRSITGADKALAQFRENARQSAITDLRNEGNALAAQYDELRSKIHMDGNVGTWRSIGTWATFGYMDNEEEIRQQMTDLEKKKSENVASLSKAMNYSDEYKEQAKKLEEFFEKDTELSRSSYAQKVADIQKEFSERETILRQLIAEQEARQDLTNAERKQLEERRNGLENLNELQRQRIELLKEEERTNLEKIKEDFERKRAENNEKKGWDERLKASPKEALAEAWNQSVKSDNAFYAAVQAREAIIGNDTVTEKQRKQLDDDVKNAQANAEKWKGRTADARKAVSEKAENDVEEIANRENAVGEVTTEREKREKSRAKEEESKAWKESSEKDPVSAQAKAMEEYAKSKEGLDEAYAKWQQLIRDGASVAVIDAQKTLVNDMEDNIDMWRQRADEVTVKEMDKRKEIANRDYQMPATLMAGSVDAQKKFIENQQKLQNPVVTKLEETNQKLQSVVDNTEEMKDSEGV